MTKKQLYQHRRQIAKTNFCVINAKNNVTSAKVQGSFSGCFFWMPLLCRVTWAPRNGTVVTPAPNYNGTRQWHHVHSLKAPSSPNHSTLQWHPAMAPSNGTRPLPQGWSSPYPNHSTQWHRTMAPAMAPRPLHPAIAGATSNPPKWFVAIPPYLK